MGKPPIRDISMTGPQLPDSPKRAFVVGVISVPSFSRSDVFAMNDEKTRKGNRDGITALEHKKRASVTAFEIIPVFVMSSTPVIAARVSKRAVFMTSTGFFDVVFSCILYDLTLLLKFNAQKFSVYIRLSVGVGKH